MLVKMEERNIVEVGRFTREAANSRYRLRAGSSFANGSSLSNLWLKPQTLKLS